MNSTEIFSLALGLERPWKIESVDIEITENSIKELHLHIGYSKGHQFKDQEGYACPVYDTKDKCRAKGQVKMRILLNPCSLVIQNPLSMFMGTFD